MKRIPLIAALMVITGAGLLGGGFQHAVAADASPRCLYARVKAAPTGGLSGNVTVCKTGTLSFDGLPVYKVDVTHVDAAGSAIVYLCTGDNGKGCGTRKPSLSTVISTACSDGPMLDFNISSAKPFKSIIFGSTDFAATLGAGKLGAPDFPPASCPGAAVTSATNVCVVFASDGIFSGGIAVTYPNVFTYWYDTTSGKYLIRFDDADWFQVDRLFVGFLSEEDPGCVGPL